MKKQRLFLYALLCACAFAALAAGVAVLPAAAQGPTPAPVNSLYPLAPGTTWTYQAHVKYDDQGAPREADLVWSMAVEEVIDRQAVRAYVMQGQLSDLTFYQPDKTPSRYLLVEIVPDRFYSSDIQNLARFEDANDLLANLVTDENLVLDLPLADGKRFCAADYITRTDAQYCWVVGAESAANTQSITGAPANAETAFPLTYRTTADNTALVFVPGLGITEYRYKHLGTVSEVEARLVEFKPGTTTASEQPTSAPAACTLVAPSGVTAYNRPSLQAERFGELTAGEPVEISARTADGWLGFDPGVAQAANVGPFRLRWINSNPSLQLEGDCGNLPVVPSLPPLACFQMFMDELPILSEPKAGALVIATAKPEDYAQVIAASADWLQLDLQVGSLQQDAKGWIARADANFNGPCDALPEPGN